MSPASWLWSFGSAPRCSYSVFGDESSSRATGQAALLEVLQAVDRCSTELSSSTRLAQRLLRDLTDCIAAQWKQPASPDHARAPSGSSDIHSRHTHSGTGCCCQSKPPITRSAELMVGRRLALESPQWLAPSGMAFGVTPAKRRQ